MARALRRIACSGLAAALPAGCFGPLELENRLCPCPEEYFCGDDGRCHAQRNFIDTRPPGSQSTPRMDAGPGAITVLTQRPEDDAYEESSGGVLASHGWISLYAPDTWGIVQFRVDELPAGATILDAYLEVFVDSEDEDDPALSIHVEPTATPAGLTGAPREISQRPRSSVFVPWRQSGIGAGFRASPSVAELVRDRVLDGAWQPGSVISFIFDADDTQGTSGGRFEMRQYGPDGFGARLFVHYLP